MSRFAHTIEDLQLYESIYLDIPKKKVSLSIGVCITQVNLLTYFLENESKEHFQRHRKK